MSAALQLDDVRFRWHRRAPCVIDVQHFAVAEGGQQPNGRAQAALQHGDAAVRVRQRSELKVEAGAGARIGRERERPVVAGQRRVSLAADVAQPSCRGERVAFRGAGHAARWCARPSAAWHA